MNPVYYVTILFRAFGNEGNLHVPITKGQFDDNQPDHDVLEFIFEQYNEGDAVRPRSLSVGDIVSITRIINGEEYLLHDREWRCEPIGAWTLVDSETWVLSPRCGDCGHRWEAHGSKFRTGNREFCKVRTCKCVRFNNTGESYS